MKKALIIGSSRGLGLAFVDEQLKRGWQVTATVRSASEPLSKIADTAAGNLTIERLDINSRTQLMQLARRLQGQTFDLLFLNAGILMGHQTLLADIADDDVTSMFFTNAISPIRVADALVDIVAPGGMVAFMSSRLGSIATNDDGVLELYRASKAALNSLIRSFRARNAQRDLTVLALHPGVVRTAMGGPDAPLDIATSVGQAVTTHSLIIAMRSFPGDQPWTGLANTAPEPKRIKGWRFSRHPERQHYRSAVLLDDLIEFGKRGRAHPLAPRRLVFRQPVRCCFAIRSLF